jgi:hypothetical protein
MYRMGVSGWAHLYFETATQSVGRGNSFEEPWGTEGDVEAWREFQGGGGESKEDSMPGLGRFRFVHSSLPKKQFQCHDVFVNSRLWSGWRRGSLLTVLFV